MPLFLIKKIKHWHLGHSQGFIRQGRTSYTLFSSSYTTAFRWLAVSFALLVAGFLQLWLGRNWIDFGWYEPGDRLLTIELHSSFYYQRKSQQLIDWTQIVPIADLLFFIHAWLLFPKPAMSIHTARGRGPKIHSLCGSGALRDLAHLVTELPTTIPTHYTLTFIVDSLHMLRSPSNSPFGMCLVFLFGGRFTLKSKLFVVCWLLLPSYHESEYSLPREGLPSVAAHALMSLLRLHDELLQIRDMRYVVTLHYMTWYTVYFMVLLNGALLARLDMRLNPSAGHFPLHHQIPNYVVTVSVL